MVGAARSSRGPDYDARDPRSIREFGRRIVGQTARQVYELIGNGVPDSASPPATTKNVLGDLAESYFGLRKNNRSEPDFIEAGVELKILPLRRRANGSLGVKEPTSICMIDYETLPDERWETASVRPKLGRILFVFVEVDSSDIWRSRVKDVELWSPRPAENLLFEGDWRRTQGYVARGEAELLSESQAEALAARRKGIGGPSDVGRVQPRSLKRAKSRAWALKSSFTSQLFKEIVLGCPYESAQGTLKIPLTIDAIDRTQVRVVERVRESTGKSLRELTKNFHVPTGASKSLAATIVKWTLGFESLLSEIREFDQLGVSVKTLNLSLLDGHPFEAVSFPVVNLIDLVNQDWEGTEAEDGTPVKEGSELAEQLHKILFVPMFSRSRKEPQMNRILGRSFFWSPTTTELSTIQQEWRMYQAEVSEGKLRYHRYPGRSGRRNDVTPASQTEIIHMRPHARNARDEYRDPKGNLVTKQCFWLNKPFVWKLVRESGALPPSCKPGGGRNGP